MRRAYELPEAIQWHEGMLLAPHHFQQLNLRLEELISYHIMASSPFQWGISHLKIDPVLLVNGTLRVTELEAIMPDGLLAHHPYEGAEDLEVDLEPYLEEMDQHTLMVHLAVPTRKPGTGPVKGALARYYSTEGEPVVDENTGEMDLVIPRLRPRLSLLVTDTPPQKYVSFPLAEVSYSNEAFSLTDFMAPTLRVDVKSELGQMCLSVARRLREKAVFLSDRVRSPSSALRGPMLLETKGMVQSLISSLPFFEAVLTTGVSHPYHLYLALCSLVGQMASLGAGLVPPVLKPYNHNDLRATFEQAIGFIFKMVDEGILESHTAVPFHFEKGMFTLGLEESWLGPVLIVGARARPGMSEDELLEWIDGSLIGSKSKIASMQEKRVLGAARKRIEGDEELVPRSGVTLFAVRATPEFIEPDEELTVLNTADLRGEKGPSELTLYVRTEPAKPKPAKPEPAKSKSAKKPPAGAKK